MKKVIEFEPKSKELSVEEAREFVAGGGKIVLNLVGETPSITKKPDLSKKASITNMEEMRKKMYPTVEQHDLDNPKPKL